MRNEIDLSRNILHSAIGLFAIAFVTGCEDEMPVSSSSQVAPQPASTQATPVMAARREKLDPIPFTVEIPGDWYVGLNSLGTDIVLRGPVAKDDPMGYLAREGSLKQNEEISKERAEAMILQFKQDGEKKDDTDVIVYEIGPITAVEINHRGPSAVTQPSEPVETLVQQSIHLFGPGTDGKRTHSLIRFRHDTIPQFEADREALTKIIKSLQVLETTPVETTPVETTPVETTQPVSQ